MASFIMFAIAPIIMFIIFKAVKVQQDTILPHAILTLSGSFMFIQARVFARNEALR